MSHIRDPMPLRYPPSVLPLRTAALELVLVSTLHRDPGALLPVRLDGSRSGACAAHSDVYPRLCLGSRILGDRSGRALESPYGLRPGWQPRVCHEARDALAPSDEARLPLCRYVPTGSTCSR